MDQGRFQVSGSRCQGTEERAFGFERLGGGSIRDLDSRFRGNDVLMGNDLSIGSASALGVARYCPAASRPRRRGSILPAVDSRFRGNDVLMGNGILMENDVPMGNHVSMSDDLSMGSFSLLNVVKRRLLSGLPQSRIPTWQLSSFRAVVHGRVEWSSQNKAGAG